MAATQAFSDQLSKLLARSDQFNVKLVIDYNSNPSTSSGQAILGDLKDEEGEVIKPVEVVANWRFLDKKRRPFVKVPLAPHIIDFYEQAFKSPKTGLVHARLNNFMAGTLQMFTEKQPYTRYISKRRLPGLKLKMYLPDSYRYAFVTEDMIYSLSDHLTQFFKEFFLAYVEGAVSCGITDNAAVETFISKYNISPDYWCADTARKVWRDRKDRKM